jgi:hypothetical protein
MNPQKQRLVALIMVLSVSSVVSFSLRSTSHVCDASRPFFCTSTSLNGILDGDDGSKSDGVDFATFNPLKQNNSGSKKTAAFGYTGTRISLRKTTMSEMTNKLLSSGGDSETMNSILEEYRDFLLEPLEDQEAVLVSIIYPSALSIIPTAFSLITYLAVSI